MLLFLRLGLPPCVGSRLPGWSPLVRPVPLLLWVVLKEAHTPRCEVKEPGAARNVPVLKTTTYMEKACRFQLTERKMERKQLPGTQHKEQAAPEVEAAV